MTVVAARRPPRPLMDDGNSQAGPTEHGRPDSHPCARSTRSSGYATHPTSRSAIPRERVRRLQRQAEETHKITRQHAQRGPISQPKRPATNSLRTPNTDPSMWVFGVLGRRSLLFEENSGYVSDLGPRLERGGRRTTASRSIEAPKTTSPLPDVKPKPPEPREIQPPRPPAPPARDRIGRRATSTRGSAAAGPKACLTLAGNPTRTEREPSHRPPPASTLA